MEMFIINIVVIVWIFSIISCILGLPEEQVAKIKTNHYECVQETGVDESEVYDLQQGDFSNEDDTLKMYVFCMFVKAGIMTEDGIFLKDAAMAKLPEDADRDTVSEAIDLCINEKGDTPHETAFYMAKCYAENNPDLIF